MVISRGESTLKSALNRLLALLLVLHVVLFGPSLDGCTTFCLDDGQSLLFGRNYDWSIGVGLVMVNNKGLSKSALIPPLEAPARWVSTYGSVTFNQYGRELPMGGMNEKGFVVEVMWLQGTVYPERDDRPALRELTWVQYLLDTCRSVDEVIATDAAVRITRDSVPVHFLICDSTGDAAVVEFIEGRMVVHRAEGLPFEASANNTYADSLRYLKSCEGFGGERVIPPESTNSLDRFARAARGVARYDRDDDGEAIAHAFKILADVSQGKATRWSIVYDVKNLAILFKTNKLPKLKIVELENFDFSCDSPCRVLDVDFDSVGDVHECFDDYTFEINRKLIHESWKNTTFLANTPDMILEMIAGHPESFSPAKKEGGQE